MQDNSAAMAEKNKLDPARQRLLDLADEAGESLSGLSVKLGKNRSYLENFVRKGSPRELAHEDRVEIARLLGPHVRPDELSVVVRNRTLAKGTVARTTRNHLASSGGGQRTVEYEPLTELVYVIGKVQAGAWMEAYEFERPEWEEMPQPVDPRFPGIQRYALRNVGESMNEVCPDGGIWVFVRFMDLTGQGPQPDNYVIVERRRGGLVEATCKQFKLDAKGIPGLYPQSKDPSFKPLPLEGESDVEEIRVIGRVTDIQRKV